MRVSGRSIAQFGAKAALGRASIDRALLSVEARACGKLDISDWRIKTIEEEATVGRSPFR